MPDRLKVAFDSQPQTSLSGTITLGGTAQELAPVNRSRVGFAVQNPPSETLSLWIRVGGTATADEDSLELQPGDYYETPPHQNPVGAISIIAATTGHTFFAEEW